MWKQTLTIPHCKHNEWHSNWTMKAKIPATILWNPTDWVLTCIWHWMLNSIHIKQVMMSCTYDTVMFSDILLLLSCIEYMKYTKLLQMIVVSVSLSVTWLNSASLCINGWMNQDQVWGEHSWRAKEHCVRKGSWSLNSEGEGELGKILPILDISRLAEARDLKFVHMSKAGVINQN